MTEQAAQPTTQAAPKARKQLGPWGFAKQFFGGASDVIQAGAQTATLAVEEMEDLRTTRKLQRAANFAEAVREFEELTSVDDFDQLMVDATGKLELIHDLKAKLNQI